MRQLQMAQMSFQNDRDFVLPTMQKAVAYHQNGDLAKAEHLYQQVLKVDTYHADANQFLGMIAHKCGFYEEAAQLISNAIKTDPNRAQCHYILAVISDQLGDTEKAILCYKKCISLKPDFIEAHNNLGIIYKNTHAFEDAITQFKAAVTFKPDSSFALGNLGNVLKESGRITEAIETLEKAVAADPSFSAGYSNLLLTLNYRSDTNPITVFEKHKCWDNYCLPSTDKTAFHFQERKFRDKKLRLAYVSPDLHAHSVAYFIEPLLKAHDKNKFELFAYYNYPTKDGTSTRLRTYFDQWIDVFGMSDNVLARKIFEDNIDILVDLAGHSANNRLAVFAQKPAPIQVTYLGYPNTTGLIAMDYRITDEIADPKGESESLNSESLIRLKNGFLCYQGDNSLPLSFQCPFDKNGHFTFGSFNNLIKISDEVIAVWAKILKSVSSSKLLLKADQLSDASTKKHCLEVFEKEGISQKQLIFSGLQPKYNDHMALYNNVDLALDPFPYNGTTTTCEALWMGVPTITCRGKTHASRVGASILHRVGLDEFIADNLRNYIELACSKANSSLDDLKLLRHSLRARMQNSPLCNGNDFARNFEAAYQKMWLEKMVHFKVAGQRERFCSNILDF